MASEEIENFLAKCPTPESGCYASDPDAMEGSLFFIGDLGIRTDLRRVSDAATKAAIAGVPLEEAVYEPVEIEEVGPGGRLTEVSPNGSEITTFGHKFGHGEPTRIVDSVDEHDEIGQLRQRVARCAYACGKRAVGCPLRTPPPEDSLA